MLLKQEGKADSLNSACEKLGVALKESPNDPLARHSLGLCFFKLHKYEPARQTVEPLLTSKDPRTLELAVRLLCDCYSKLNLSFEQAQLKAKFPGYIKR